MLITRFSLLYGFLVWVLPIQGKGTTCASSRYNTIKHTQSGAILNVIFHNNSTNINIYDNKFQSDLYDLVSQLQNDTTVKVIVFRSGNPEFFFAHGELMARDGEKSLCCYSLIYLSPDYRNSSQLLVLMNIHLRHAKLPHRRPSQRGRQRVSSVLQHHATAHGYNRSH